MATMITFFKKDMVRMTRLYGEGKSLYFISMVFNVSIPIIRRALVDEGVHIRGRGRPKKTTAFGN